MNWLRRLFGRRPAQQPQGPAPHPNCRCAPARLELPDAITASRAGLTEAQWRNLTDDERNKYRWRAGIG